MLTKLANHAKDVRPVPTQKLCVKYVKGTFIMQIAKIKPPKKIQQIPDNMFNICYKINKRDFELAIENIPLAIVCMAMIPLLKARGCKPQQARGVVDINLSPDAYS